MGLCKCQKRKVTNLFCFEHDVNVCEYCLVSDHERCIVQSYVQWLQDSDYNPICILCKNLLKDEPTVRLVCYDVFHWSCLDKYASELPANTAPAGYQCPKCKECIFPPPNLVSPVVDVLKQKLETVNWSRVGLGQSLIQIDDVPTSDEQLVIEKVSLPKNSSMANLIANTTDDESNGFVIVKQKEQSTNINKNNKENDESTRAVTISIDSSPTTSTTNPIPSTSELKQEIKPQSISTKKPETKSVKIDMGSRKFENSGFNDFKDETISHNRANTFQQSSFEPMNQTYDSSLGVVLNVDNLDNDTGSWSTEDDPALDPLNNPNIRVE